ncbi:375_t:CDS:2, partial [Scutellospora calospora]
AGEIKLEWCNNFTTTGEIGGELNYGHYIVLWYHFWFHKKNIEIEEIIFKSDIQYKEITVKQVDTIKNDQYKFYRNGELMLKNDHLRKQTKIANKSIVSSERVFENDREDQTPEIIELSSNEDDQTPEVIELSSDKDNQIPEIIELSSDEVIEKDQIAVFRDQTPETDVINYLNM